MTVGESIQKYRKDLGLSQEELGQKLLVSRQTVSLWEKDQTVPTIDNLMKLKEVFGVSVDEILGVEEPIQAEINNPDEAYRFHFSKDELNEMHRSQRKVAYKRPIRLALVYVVLFLLILINQSVPESMIGLAFGGLFFIAVFYIKSFSAYNKNWKSYVERISESDYEYMIFEDHIIINIYRKNELLRRSKCYFSDIEKIQQLDQWLFFVFGGQSYIVRQSDLKENSAFYSFMYNNPSKTIVPAMPNKWKIISDILFFASLFSIFVALPLMGLISEKNGLTVENMWVFFALTPIPISSAIFGFVLKSKGFKYKKNVIVGIIMTFFLCIYGSFIFMF